MPAKLVASSNGRVSQAVVSNGTSTEVVKIAGTSSDCSETNLIELPTPSTNQKPVEYSSGVTSPWNFNFIPFDNSIPVLVLYVFFPKISASMFIAVFSVISKVLMIPLVLISFLLI